jgi:hypothetical protein
MRRAASSIKRNGGVTGESLLARFQDHLKYTRGRHSAGATDFDKLASLSLAIRDLAALISECLGDGWVRDLDALRGLEPFAEKKEFLQRFLAVNAASQAHPQLRYSPGQSTAKSRTATAW